MSWMDVKSKAIFYGLEYEHPVEMSNYVYTKDYEFDSVDDYVVYIFYNILEALSVNNKDLVFSEIQEEWMVDEEEYHYLIWFTCEPSLFDKVSYILDAYTDGWGYKIIELDRS